MQHLPNELFAWICQYIPVFPYLLRYRQVCKTWQQQLQSHIFATVQNLDLCTHLNAKLYNTMAQSDRQHLEYLAKLLPNIRILFAPASIAIDNVYTCTSVIVRQTVEYLNLFAQLQVAHLFPCNMVCQIDGPVANDTCGPSMIYHGFTHEFTQGEGLQWHQEAHGMLIYN